MKIKLSKNQWKSIGKQAGWIKIAKTVGELAKEVYPELNFDHALPQDIVNAASKAGYEMVGNFVWAYPNGNTFGLPAPITVKGYTMIATPKFLDAIGYNGSAFTVLNEYAIYDNLCK